MNPSIGFIGGGRITSIFLAAWKDAGLSFKHVVVSDPDAALLAALKASFPELHVVTDNRTSAACDVVFLALHPPVARTVLPEVADAFLPEALVVSLAPVLDFRQLAQLLGGASRLARMIPNAPSLIRRGFNPMAWGPGLSDADRQLLTRLFAPLGEHPLVEEADLEAYAILAAMGPTYFWFQWQALRELGQGFGLEPKAVDRALKAMLDGASAMLLDSGMDFAQVNDTVPVKPLAEAQEAMLAPYRDKLPALFARLKGQ